MSLAIPCPYCDDSPVSDVRNAWFIQGFLILARYGSRTYVGCASCTRKKVLGSMVLSGLLGWWCFPWGLGTPFVLLQNLVSVASSTSRKALADALASQGIDIDDVELDDSGRSPGQVALIEGILATLHEMTWADGSADPREVESGVEIATQMLGDLVSAEDVHDALSVPEAPGDLDPAPLGPDSRLLLFRAAGEIVAADGVVADSEIQALRALGERLSLPPELVEISVAALRATDEESRAERESLRHIAADLLGVSVDTPLAQVQTAYRSAKLEAGSTSDEDAAERLKEIEWAYQTLVG